MCFVFLKGCKYTGFHVWDEPVSPDPWRSRKDDRLTEETDQMIKVQWWKTYYKGTCISFIQVADAKKISLKIIWILVLPYVVECTILSYGKSMNKEYTFI